MYKRLISFLNTHNILYNYQFGFRENHSTSLALIEIVDNILKAMEEGKLVAGIFLDLSKVFDTIDHVILLDKLQHYGILGQPHDWFRSYLDNRQQFTIANNMNSSLKTVTHGVLQGCVLGPLLFLIYINDISNCTDSDCLNRLFADDANVFISRHSAQDLKDSMIKIIKQLFELFRANKLTVNLNKTCYTIFRSINKTVPDFLSSIKIDDIIKRVKCAKFLGLSESQCTTPSKHICNMQLT